MALREALPEKKEYTYCIRIFLKYDVACIALRIFVELLANVAAQDRRAGRAGRGGRGRAARLQRGRAPGLGAAAPGSLGCRRAHSALLRCALRARLRQRGVAGNSENYLKNMTRLHDTT